MFAVNILRSNGNIDIVTIAGGAETFFFRVMPALGYLAGSQLRKPKVTGYYCVLLGIRINSTVCENRQRTSGRNLGVAKTVEGAGFDNHYHVSSATTVTVSTN